MKRLLLLLTLLFTLPSHGQEMDYKEVPKFNIGASYYRLDGNPLLGLSVDLTTALMQPKGGATFGFGIQSGVFFPTIQNSESLSLALDSIVPNSKGTTYMVPFEIYYITGGRENYLELAAGLAFAQFYGRYTKEENGLLYTYKKNHFNSFRYLKLGFRHQPEDKGVFFSVAWQPMWRAGEGADHLHSYRIGLGITL